MTDKFKDIRISNYSYNLPEERIAKYPLNERDASKLLYIENKEIKHTRFKNLSSLLKKNDLLIFNNAKVIQARLHFQKETGAKIEIFCLEPHEPADYNLSFQAKEKCRWKCMIGNLKKWKTGSLNKQITINSANYILSANKIGEINNSVIVEFNWKPENCTSEKISFGQILDYAGKTPLPPYLNRSAELKDKSTYQTVYAKHEGSVAAPTAGLHFTDEVFNDLNNKGITTCELTLHVGAGTFRPVKSETIKGHSMHEEHFRVEKSFLKEMTERKGRRIAVGTTSVRTLESLYYMGVKILQNPDYQEELFLSQWEAYELPDKFSAEQSFGALIEYMDKKGKDYLDARTQIIIVPGYIFKVIDGLITNFHQPQSTLLLLIAAVIGEKWKKVYQYAMENNFRFLSYGDSSLFLVQKVFAKN